MKISIEMRRCYYDYWLKMLKSRYGQKESGEGYNPEYYINLAVNEIVKQEKTVLKRLEKIEERKMEKKKKKPEVDV